MYILTWRGGGGDDFDKLSFEACQHTSYYFIPNQSNRYYSVIRKQGNNILQDKF